MARFRIICDNCGREVVIKRSTQTFKSSVRHFCSRECFNEYVRRHPEEFGGSKSRSNTLRKLVDLVEVKRGVKKLFGEE